MSLNTLLDLFGLRGQSGSSSTQPTTAGGSSLQMYSYQPLSSGRSIRLVKLISIDVDEVPHCSLIEFDLEGTPIYNALSYTWGSPSPEATAQGTTADRCCPIRIGDKTLLVTRNLLDFLRRVWRSHCSVVTDLIWIDAISIDQDNVYERSSQVGMMTDIYKSAKQVIVWLGEEIESTEMAIQLVSCIGLIPLGDLDTFNVVGFDDPKLRDKFGSLGNSIPHWNALSIFLNRTWFSRVWIIQEILVAKHITVFCGKHRISWLDLVKVSNFSVSQADLLIGSSASTRGTAILLFRYREIMRQERDVDMYHMSYLTRSFQATDPRDKLFSLLGVSAPLFSSASGSYPLRPDYTQSAREVYVQFSRAFIHTSHDLAPLTVVGALPPNIPDLPSWVPDYSVIGFDDAGHRLWNKASGDLQRIIYAVPDPNLLSIGGAKLDLIIDVSDEIRTSFRFSECFPHWVRLIKGLDPTYITGQHRLEAFWRTLLRDTPYGTFPPAPGKYRSLFHDWMLVEAFDVLPSQEHPEDSGTDMQKYEQLFCMLNDLSRDDPTGLIPNSAEINICMREKSKASNEDLERWYSEGRQFAIAFLRRAGPIKLFNTRNKLLGRGPSSLEIGDSVWIIPGVRVPMILRESSTDERFRLIGPAYVHGVMRGEALERGHLNMKNIVLE